MQSLWKCAIALMDSKEEALAAKDKAQAEDVAMKLVDAHYYKHCNIRQ